MRFPTRVALMAAAVALVATACEGWVTNLVGDERATAGVAPVTRNAYLNEQAVERSSAGCDAGQPQPVADAAAAYQGETAHAVAELTAAAPLDPTEPDPLRRQSAATWEIWQEWRHDPTVTDERWDALGVGGVTCDDTYYLTALFRQGPQMPDSGRYASLQHPVSQISEQLDVVYTSAVTSQGEEVDLALDLFFPPDVGDGDRPLVLVFHGGGFIQGDKADARGAARTYARTGYVAASVGYRLRPEESNLPLSQRIGAATDGIDDAMEAVRWSKANAETLGIDPERIAAVGFSAGGVIALGLSIADDPTPGGPLAAFEPDIAAGVATGVAWSISAPFVTNEPDDAPVLMFHFDVDPATGSTATIELATCESIRAAGNTCDFRVNPGEGHTVNFGPTSGLWAGDTGPFMYHHLRLDDLVARSDGG
ncbi:MAG: alpha/beta hydrolase [Acidimicrobiia bacterium]|nr:alpha/beta hydrolase [Acidimicrobiia bacterium]